MLPTKHVSRARLETKDLLVLKRVGKPQQETGAPFEAVQGVLAGHLQAASHDSRVELPETCAVHLAGLSRVAAEDAGLEHLQTGDGKPLASAVDSARLLALVLPLGAGACVEEDGDEEQVEQATGALLVVDRGRPRGHELVDSRAAADVKVLPAAVGGDRGVVGRIVALHRISLALAMGR